VFSPPARRDHLERLRGLGVGRLLLLAPSADAREVERFLDTAAALKDAVSE
jgi:hypothetical protein